jgi:hypothetical protein
MEIILLAIVVLVALSAFDAHLWPSTPKAQPAGRRRATRRTVPCRRAGASRRSPATARRTPVSAAALFGPTRRASYAGRWWWD